MRGAPGALVLLACQGGGETLTIPGPVEDTDTDTDVDTAVDADTGTDTDTDIGTDTDPSTGTQHVFDEDHVLVVPDGVGLSLLANDGSTVWFRTWAQMMGGCPLCGGEGASADGDGLLVAFTVGGPVGNGAIARLNAAGELDFRVDGFPFPHDAHRDPSDGSIIVSETLGQRISWIPGDGSSSQPLWTLDGQDDGWIGQTPNGNELFDYNGRHYLLVSHRGGGGFQSAGAITMWDITEPSQPSLQWRFPSTGALDTPHGCMYRQWNGQWWLLWAHTEGAPQGGSVGIAVTDDPTQPPAYVADLLPSEALAPFRFLRGVELTEDGWLYLTDSGSFGFGGPANGRVIRAAMPTLTPTGATGSVVDQVYVELEQESVLASGLDQPFEGWLWVPTFPLDSP